MKKRFFSVLLAAAMALTMGACSSNSADYTVGICQLAPHPALDAATGDQPDKFPHPYRIDAAHIDSR